MEAITMNENQFSITFGNFVDFETSSIEVLIVEREDYENSYFNHEDMLKSEELDRVLLNGR